MLTLRKAVFYVFAVIYLLLCPLIVARMLGFVFNPSTLHLIKTGLIYISTNPPDAAVYVDGRLAHQRSPTILRDLTPGSHFLRVEQDGYNDWEGNVPVKGKKATLVANILLIPQTWPQKAISGRSYENLYFAAPDFLIAVNPTLKDIGLYHTTAANRIEELANTTSEALFSKNSIYADGTLVKLFNVNSSPFVVIEAAIKDKHKFLWINFKETPPRIEDISDLFPEEPSRIAWSSAESDNIYAFYPDHIYRINVKDKAIYPQRFETLSLSVQRSPAGIVQDEFLINDNNDLLIRQGNSIRLLPREGFAANAHASDIAKAMPSTNMYFEEKTGMLYFLDEDSHLNAAQILPYHPVLNIPIPDALRTKMDSRLRGNDSAGKK